MAAPVWSDYGGNLPFYDPSEISKFQLLASQGNQQFIALRDDIVSKVGNLDAYLAKQKEYLADKRAYDKANLSPAAAKESVATADRLSAQATKAQDNLTAQQKAAEQARTDRYNSIRSQLENQYNNLVKFDSRLSYQGRSSDLPAIFNQQAAQLADAGVSDITRLRNQDGRLVDLSTGKVVSTSNLNGQIAVDRDTGVQKWGDIFSGVKGGANYGITFASDGSPIFFPAWEKTKSPIAQIGMEFLEPVIVPIATVAGYAFGGPVGAGVGNSVGQFLATGQVEVEQAILAAGTAYVGSELLGGTDAAAAGEAGATAATSTAVPGSFQAALPDLGVQTAATTAGATAVPGSFAAALPGLLAPVNVAGSVPLEVGQTFTPAPGSFQEALPGLGVETQASAGGFTAAPGSFQAALPGLGVAAFPSVAMNPIIDGASALPGIDAGTAATTAGGLSTTEAVLAASALAGGQQQPQAYRSGYGGGGQAAGVDASGLLALLQGKAGVPGVSSLLSPVVSPMASPYQSLLDQPMQYQPLTRSLL